MEYEAKVRHGFLERALSTLSEEVREALHLSVLSLSERGLIYAGHNDDKFVYPASIYKLYIALGVLQAISLGRIALDTQVRVKAHNVVDHKREIEADTRPLIEEGAVASVCYLLDFMVTGSSNTAANELIDLVARARINSLIRSYGWEGSDVTRKFLSRQQEDGAYREAPPTVSTTRHFAEFLYHMEMERLVNPECSNYLKALLHGQLDKTKIAAGLPASALFAHKTGWFEFEREGKVVGVSGDCGIVTDAEKRYIISAIVVRPGAEGREILKEVGRRVHELI